MWWPTGPAEGSQGGIISAFEGGAAGELDDVGVVAAQLVREKAAKGRDVTSAE